MNRSCGNQIPQSVPKYKFSDKAAFTGSLGQKIDRLRETWNPWVALNIDEVLIEPKFAKYQALTNHDLASQQYRIDLEDRVLKF